MHRNLRSRTLRCRQLAVVLAVFIAAACGRPSTAAPLNEIIRRNELVICAHANALPFSQQGGASAGFQIELGRALASELGVALRVQFMHLHREPRPRECDALVSVAVPKNPNADLDYRVSEPYMAYQSVLVVHQNTPPIRSLEDLGTGTVAVQSGSWAHYLMTQHEIPVWVRFRTDDEIIRAAETGQAHAGIVSNFSYDWYLRGHPQAAVREASEFTFNDDFGYDVAVALMEADQLLLDRVNAGLARMRDGGIIAGVLERYGIRFEPPSGTSRGTRP